MGRSVETPLDAEKVFFHHWQIEPEDYDISGTLFEEDIVEPVRHALRAAFPSFNETDEPFRNPHGHARYDETRVILENGHAQVTVSEYCGLVAVALVPRGLDESGYYEPESSLHAAWTARIANRFEKTLAETFGSQLRHIATASNGEAFFERVSA